MKIMAKMDEIYLVSPGNHGLDAVRLCLLRGACLNASAPGPDAPRSQTRLRYIADRVLQSSSDMFQKNKDETQQQLPAAENLRNMSNTMCEHMRL